MAPDPTTDAPVDEAPAKGAASSKAKSEAPAEEKRDVHSLVDELSFEDLALLRTKLDSIRPVAEPPPPPVHPLHVVASNYPLDVESTKALTMAAVAEKAECSADDLMGWSVRAPKNLDDQFIAEKAVLTVVLADGSKRAVALA